jgi:hypothetical protein
VTASQRRTVTVLVAALGVAFLLVWAAAAGPEQVITQQQTESVTDNVDDPTPSEPESDTEETTDNSEKPASAHHFGTWAQDLAAFALLVAGLSVAWLVLRQLFLRIRLGLADERLVVPLEPLPDFEVAREAIERDQARQREALAQSDVRNGIVACWVMFEQAAAEAHVEKRPAETASAFVVRFLHLLDVDPRAVGVLAQLFLEARFSSHPLPSDARSRAESALAAIHRDLTRTGAAR